MERKIFYALKKLGVPAHIQGYDYLKEAIKICLVDRDQLSMVTKSLYPTIANAFSTTPSRVERSIRHAVELSYCNMPDELVEEVFGNTSAYKPTNSQYIATIVEIIRYDENSSILPRETVSEKV